MKIVSSIKSACNVCKAFAVANADKILIYSGIGGMLTGAVMIAAKADSISSVSRDYAQNCCDLKHVFESSDKTEDDKRTLTIDSRKNLGHYITEQAKNVLPAVTVMTLSAGAILTGVGIMHRRYMAALTLVETTTNAFTEYRNRVAEKYGEEAEQSIYFGTKKKTISCVNPETNEVEKIEKAVVEDDGPVHSPYARCFDEYNKYWRKTAGNNLIFLTSVQEEANRMLKSDGYITLNQVYKMLGFDPTPEGAIVGWVKDYKDNFVDFGVFDAYRHVKPELCENWNRNSAFVNGWERSCWLDFNVDGPIFLLINRNIKDVLAGGQRRLDEQEERIYKFINQEREMLEAKTH